MKERERDDEASDSDESSPIFFTKRIDASESILKLAILVLISVLSFRSVLLCVGTFRVYMLISIGNSQRFFIHNTHCG